MSEIDNISRLFPLMDRLEQRARQSVAIALVALGVGLIWAIAASASSAEQVIVLGPALALVLVGVVLLLVAAFVELLAKEKVVPGATIAVAAPGGELVLGCWFGRTTVACGALEVGGDPGPQVPRFDRVSQLVEVKESQLSRLDSGSSRAYDALAALILDRVRVAQGSGTLGTRRFSSIGIGTPGIVDLQTGTLTLSVTVSEADIPREVARRLLSSDKHAIGAVFDEDPQNESALADRIFVDNDVRCVARHELADHGWSEFACLYVGGGVGGALVMGGRVHYGAHGSAGHVGHIDLGEDGIKALPAKAGQELEPVKCDCGKVGFHLEPLANFRGLERLARAVADADGHDLLDEMLLRYDHDSDPFFSEVFPAYVTVLTGGIATLTHILDFERVVLCGSLVEQLRQNELFAQYGRDLLPRQLIDPGARPTVHEAVVREALWRGAALIGWDSGYQEHRKVAKTT